MTGLSTFYGAYPQVQLRGLAFLALSEVAIIQAVSYVSDSGGGGTAIWSNQGTTMCRIDPLGADRGVVAGQISELSTHFVTLSGTVDVDPDDRIAISGRGTFAITGTPQQTGLRYHKLEVVQV